MHDPMTVAHEIRYPWRKYGRDKARNDFERNYRESFITIWHVDPESDGSDDSCGWSYPKPSGKWFEELKREFVFEHAEKEYRPPLSVRAGVEGRQWWYLLWLQRCHFLRYGHGRRARLPLAIIRQFIWNESFPGERWHFSTDDLDTQDGAERGAWVVGRIYLSLVRPWWRHPRWHFWHWKIQIHPLQQFRRWAFSRCAGCGKGFSWGYSPTSSSWHGTGPRWFRSEEGVYHTACYRHGGPIENHPFAPNSVQ